MFREQRRHITVRIFRVQIWSNGHTDRNNKSKSVYFDQFDENMRQARSD